MSAKGSLPGAEKMPELRESGRALALGRETLELGE